MTIFSLLAGGLAASAREGLTASLAKAPAVVRRAWPATFVLRGPKVQGTAFLVSKRLVEGQVLLSFLTVNHVVDPACATGAICPGTTLASNMRVEPVDGRPTLTSIDLPKFDDVAVLARNVTFDVAVVAAAVPVALARHLPKPIPIASECLLAVGDPLYGLGFPSVTDRVETHDVIDEPRVITKRWSTGVYVDRYRAVDGGDPLMVGSTVDAISGQSGGPVLNARGEAVSVMRQTSDRKGAPYDGNETSGALDWHALGVSCDFLKSLRTNGLR